MRRLVYAPKAYVFIRSSNMGGKIYDVSNDVVSGSVTRNVNDLSEAEIVLRNRFKKWIRDSQTKQQIFLPNDLITIYLQRIAGHPIQVFTGYLDSAPFYQAYPGNCRLKASCTLKRLAFTWFDPGLDFFTAWLNTMEGWVYNPATGEALNPSFITQGQTVTDSQFAAGATKNMHDGGFARLLNDFMTVVAGWEQQDVIVSDLPAHLSKVAAKLFKSINDDAETNLNALQDLMTNIMGLGLPVGVGPSSSSSGDVPPQVKMAQQIKANCDPVPLVTMIFAGLLLSDLQANYSKPPKKGADWGYGLYALRPDNGKDGTGFTDTIETHPVADISDVSLSTKLMAKKMASADGGIPQGADKDPTVAVQWIEAALHRRLSVVKTNFAAIQPLWSQAQTLAGAAVTPEAQTIGPVNQIDVSHADFNDPQLQARLSNREKGLIASHYGAAGKKAPWLASVLWTAKDISKDLQLSWEQGLRPESILITGPKAQIQKLYNTFQGDTRVDLVGVNTSGNVKYLLNGVASTLTHQVETTPANSVLVNWPTKPTGGNQGASNSPSTDPTTGQTDSKLTFEQLAAFSANAAFASQFAFPANILESHFLTGDRALLNDVSCLDAVKQFCQASMRNFMSLPDGRFLAFYPDYFGAIRGPYWYIHDIEMTNMGIQLNDDALATHVFVVGDTFGLNSAIDWTDEVTTRGVATITQAFMLESFIESYESALSKMDSNAKPEPLGRLKYAYDFLQHYGPRPHKEEYPIIRNVFFEFLMAWQRFMQLWASQFATEVTFTFQPEVMAGGIIGFPEHSFQVYVEQVTHTWDYSGGFETQAVISSPAIMRPSSTTATDKPGKFPGFVLAGGTNTVGAAGS